MIKFLKSKGYKYTLNDTLNNKQFREAEITVEVNEELSTFDTVIFSTTKTYELFLDLKAFNITKIQDILADLRDENEVVTGSASLEKQERGYLITFIFII
jgi:hypothetical protein